MYILLLNDVVGEIIMDITKYPHYELYSFAELLFLKKDDLIPEKCNRRCVYSTIINRCYYSSYLYSLEWLFEKFGFKPRPPEDFDKNERFITEHKQVRDTLKEKNFSAISYELADLAILRKKEDYDPFLDISDDELSDAMESMGIIFEKLSF